MNNITRGNLDQHLSGPNNPSDMTQLITDEGNRKFTLHNGGGDRGVKALGPIPANALLGAHASYVVIQTQGGKAYKAHGKVEFGFVDTHGNWIGAPAVDQGSASITQAQAHAAGNIFFKAVFEGDTTLPFTFTGNAGH